ncbi:FAD-dependent oxidoreductase [soil metagenome]
MAVKPVILSVDDDPQVLGAVARDLRKRYGEDYRVVRASSGDEALQAIRELKERDTPVALLLADQRMPKMDGVAFLSEAMTLFPDAKRALLTAYADTDAAISALNQSKIHYYLLKPWDPPEEKLYPVLDDMLTDWQAAYRPPFTGIKIVSHRWSPLGHTLRDFLARSQVPYRWLDVERDDEAKKIVADGDLTPEDMPVVVFEDGTQLLKPEPGEVARQAGLNTQAGSTFYDLAIIGGGPAGLAAAVYGASEGLEVALLDREAPGGQAGTSSRIENYLGFPVGLSGADLTRRAVTQARKFGAELISPQGVQKIELKDTYKLLTLDDGSCLNCHALILTLGVSYRKLDIPGLDSLTGRGVYYGSSISEATACQDEDVYIIGAGNSAGQAAMYLANFARRVNLVVRGADLESKMSQYLVDQIRATENIQVKLETEVTAVRGTDRLEGLTLECGGQEQQAETSALFIFIGASPQTQWLGDFVMRDERGFICTGPDLKENGEWPASWTVEREPFLLETSVPGIFAAGDVRSGSVKRVASAVGEGSISVQFVHQYLADVGA